MATLISNVGVTKVKTHEDGVFTVNDFSVRIILNGEKDKPVRTFHQEGLGSFFEAKQGDLFSMEVTFNGKGEDTYFGELNTSLRNTGSGGYFNKDTPVHSLQYYYFEGGKAARIRIELPTVSTSTSEPFCLE